MDQKANAERSTCRNCGRAVVWARLNTGDWVPLDREPNDRGQMILLDGDRCYPVEPGARYGTDVQVRRHRSHVTTCGLGPRARSVATVAREVSAEAAGRRDRVAQVRRALARGSAAV